MFYKKYQVNRKQKYKYKIIGKIKQRSYIMELEKDSSNENPRETIIINSDNFPFLNDINLKKALNLRVCVDMQNYGIRKYN